MSKVSWTFPHLLFLLLIVNFPKSPLPFVHAASSNDEVWRSELFTVPAPQFVGILRSVLQIVNQVLSTMTNIGFMGDPRAQKALADCRELLDSTTMAVDWTISASQSPKESKNNSTGNVNDDLRTWLSAATTNQDTCIDGFDGSSNMFAFIVLRTISQISSSLRQSLSMINPGPDYNGMAHGNSRGLTEEPFPRWVSSNDRKLLQDSGVTPDVVVAKDGSGSYVSIMDALDAAPEFSMTRYVIYIKEGIYNEHVEVRSRMWNIMMLGDGINRTIITGSNNVVDGYTTYNSATVAVKGRGFIARDMTFENTAGPEKRQAVALRSDSDLSVFFRCEFLGYQDTLYTHSMRQFYRECSIKGTIDFIFGNAAAVFQNCDILLKKGLATQKNTVTAHGRTDPNQPTGFTLQFCNISADFDLLPNLSNTSSFLGRPWKNYSTTVVLQSYLSDAISPPGWLPWNDDSNLDTLYYGEYMNAGPGSELAGRVTWPGYHRLTSDEVNNFTVSHLIDGDLWLPSTGISFASGLQS